MRAFFKSLASEDDDDDAVYTRDQNATHIIDNGRPLLSPGRKATGNKAKLAKLGKDDQPVIITGSSLYASYRVVVAYQAGFSQPSPGGCSSAAALRGQTLLQNAGYVGVFRQSNDATNFSASASLVYVHIDELVNLANVGATVNKNHIPGRSKLAGPFPCSRPGCTFKTTNILKSWVEHQRNAHTATAPEPADLALAGTDYCLVHKVVFQRDICHKCLSANKKTINEKEDAAGALAPYGKLAPTSAPVTGLHSAQEAHVYNQSDDAPRRAPTERAWQSTARDILSVCTASASSAQRSLAFSRFFQHTQAHPQRKGRPKGDGEPRDGADQRAKRPPLPTPSHHEASKAESSAHLSVIRRALFLCGIGQYSKANSALDSSGTLPNLTPEVKEMLDSYFIQRQNDPSYLLDINLKDIPRVAEQDLINVLRDKSGQGTGGDRLGQTYDILWALVKQHPEVAAYLTNFVQDICDNTVSPDVRRELAHQRGIALTKVRDPLPAVRPIGLYPTIVKIAEILLINHHAGELAKQIGPHAASFRVKGGAAANSFTVRAWASRSDSAILSFDLSASFNRVLRVEIFDKVKANPLLAGLHGILNFGLGTAGKVTYADNSDGSHSVDSTTGTTQGSSTGPINHELAMRPRFDDVEDKTKNPVASFLDDSACCVDSPTIDKLKQVLKVFSECVAAGGGQLNALKTKILLPADSNLNPADVADELGIAHENVVTDGIVVCGVAITRQTPAGETFMRAHVQRSIDKATLKLDRLDLVQNLGRATPGKERELGSSAHVLSTLMRVCICPSLTFVVQTHPRDVIADLLNNFDDLIWTRWKRLAGISLTGVDHDQATRSKRLFFLPAALNGLGFTSMFDIADAAFVGSHALSMAWGNEGFDCYRGSEAERGRRLHGDARRIVASRLSQDKAAKQAGHDPVEHLNAQTLPDTRPVEESTVPGLGEALRRLREAGVAAVNDFSPTSFADAPILKLQKIITAELNEKKHASLYEDAPAEAKGWLAASRGGLLSQAYSAIPFYYQVIFDEDFCAAARATLLAPLFNLNDERHLSSQPDSNNHSDTKDRICRECSMPIIADGRHAFDCPKLKKNLQTHSSNVLVQVLNVLLRKTGVGIRKLTVSQHFERKKGDAPVRSDGSLVEHQADNIWAETKPGGQQKVYLSDTYLMAPDLGNPDTASRHGALLATGMKKKTDHYNKYYDIRPAQMRHMIFETHGAVHGDSAALIKELSQQWAKSKRLDPAVCIATSYKSFGTAVLRHYGHSLYRYGIDCHPRPRPPAAGRDAQADGAAAPST